MVTVAVALFAPTAFALYRCQMMGTTTTSPCCADYKDRSSAPGNRLQADRCCTQVVVLVERAPSDLYPREDAPPLLSLGATHVAAPLVAHLPLSTPRAWTRAGSDAGPPVFLLIRSLLI